MELQTIFCPRIWDTSNQQQFQTWDGLLIVVEVAVQLARSLQNDAFPACHSSGIINSNLISCSVPYQNYFAGSRFNRLPNSLRTSSFENSPTIGK